MSKGGHGREGSVGSLVAVCEGGCGLAVEDTSKFVELHNIMYASTFSFSQTVVATWTMLLFASLNHSVSMTRFQALHPWKIPANFDHHIPRQLAQVNQGFPTKIEQKAPQLKRKFGENRSWFNLSRYGSPYSKMG